MANNNFTYIKDTEKGKDPIRYPKIQVEYEKEFKENYSKTLKTIKVGLIQLID